MKVFLDEFLYEIDKFKNLDEDIFLDVTSENPIDIEFAKKLDEKKKMFKELRNKLGSSEDGKKNLIQSVKDKMNLLIPRIESCFKYRLDAIDRIKWRRALIVNVNLTNSSDLSTNFKTNELENHFKDSNYEVLWDKVEDLSDLSDKDKILNLANGKMFEINIMVLNYRYKWHGYFDNQMNEKLLEDFKKNIPRNWKILQIIHTPNYFYVRHYISPTLY